MHSSLLLSPLSPLISLQFPSRSILHRPTIMDAEKTATTAHEESSENVHSQLGHLVNAEDHEYGKWTAIRKNS
jgi:hypothetical protein